jgi:hypothetical protein
MVDGGFAVWTVIAVDGLESVVPEELEAGDREDWCCCLASMVSGAGRDGKR